MDAHLATDGARQAIEESEVGARWSRWRARAPRYLVTAVLLLFFAIGVRHVLAPASAAVARAAGGAQHDPAVEDFALQFARAYLTYDTSHPSARERQLASFVPQNLGPDAGYLPGGGTQRVEWAEVASNQRALAGGREITVAAQTTGQAPPVYLAVSVLHEKGGGLVLRGYPSFVGPPAVNVRASAVDRQPVEDRAVVEVTNRVVSNYLSGQAQNLGADLSREALVTLPTIQLRVTASEQTVWSAGPGSHAVLATVDAADSRGGSYTLTYELGIAYRDRPYVTFIEAVPTGA